MSQSREEPSRARADQAPCFPAYSPIDQRALSPIFSACLRQGLADHTQPLKCLATFITKFPSGRERGTFITLDLGGTNARIGHVELHGDGQWTKHLVKSRLADVIGLREAAKEPPSGLKIFDHLATLVHDYIDTSLPLEGG